MPVDMSGEQWAANLLQGSVGALISIIGLFFVFWFTRNHELDLSLRVQRAERERAVEERTLANAGKVSQAFISIDSHHLDEKVTGLAEFINSLVMFSFQEGRDHPGAADWAMGQGGQLTSALYGNENLQLIMRMGAGMIGTLSAWTRLGCPQDMLAEESPEESKAEWEEVRKEIDPALAVTWADLKSTDPNVRAEANRRMSLWG